MSKSILKTRLEKQFRGLKNRLEDIIESEVAKYPELTSTGLALVEELPNPKGKRFTGNWSTHFYGEIIYKNNEKKIISIKSPYIFSKDRMQFRTIHVYDEKYHDLAVQLAEKLTRETNVHYSASIHLTYTDSLLADD